MGVGKVPEVAFRALNKLKTTFTECQATRGSKNQSFFPSLLRIHWYKNGQGKAEHCKVKCPICGRLVLVFNRIYEVRVQGFRGNLN